VSLAPKLTDRERALVALSVSRAYRRAGKWDQSMVYLARAFNLLTLSLEDPIL
jgi:hypothetical protein